MPISLCVIMDDIESIHIKKDTTFALMRQAQACGHKLFYANPTSLSIRQNQVWVDGYYLTVEDNPKKWFHFQQKACCDIVEFDIVLMRQDPPFDINYLNTTYLLDLAVQQGAYVINDPSSVRDANEKLFGLGFDGCSPPTFVGSKIADIQQFLKQHQKIVVKPLNQLGGTSIFILEDKHPNVNVTLELLTHNQTTLIMTQKYLPAIVDGDKRVLMIGGKPLPYALARIPPAGDFRGNLVAGAKAVGQPLSERDKWLCRQIGPTLVQKNILLAGVDIIGDYVTEINVTSPTCVRELEAAFEINICQQILDCLLANMPNKPKR